MKLTWRQLQTAVNNLTDEQLDSTVQICVDLPHCGQVVEVEQNLQFNANPNPLFRDSINDQPYLNVEAEY